MIQAGMVCISVEEGILIRIGKSPLERIREAKLEEISRDDIGKNDVVEVLDSCGSMTNNITN